ncbi:ATPase [Spirochaetia bacterium]|nr:ATPase [Spirochaetia bacterium]
MIDRPYYVQKLIGFKDKQLIKIVTGVRRCGKSTLFQLFQEYLLNNGAAPNQIQTINLEDVDNTPLLDYAVLHNTIKARLVSDKMNYVFLDEIQNVPDFQKAANSLFIKKNVDLYLTGSNSRVLSGEWATMLSGRYVTIQMLPLSFKEYASAFPGTSNVPELYRHYIENSSFPYTLELQNSRDQIHDYLRGLYSTVLLKDIIENKKIVDVMQLENVIKFMFNNIGNEVSVNKIKNTLATDGRKITPQTIEHYLEALTDSFILYKAGRYDVKGKQYLKTLEKYYLVDIGLRSFLLGNANTDAGHILENVIYLELIRRGYTVYIGKVGAAEVDFVATKNGRCEYYQAALTVLDPATLKRELAPLDAIADHNPKYLITADYFPASSYNGIQHVNAFDWLLE